jgi:hypothetical protein
MRTSGMTGELAGAQCGSLPYATMWVFSGIGVRGQRASVLKLALQTRQEHLVPFGLLDPKALLQKTGR